MESNVSSYDQLVPQLSSLLENDLSFANCNPVENVSFQNLEKSVFTNTDLPPIGSNTNQIPIPVMDQQIDGSESPKSFTDLDQVLYEEPPVFIKQERFEHSDCIFSQEQSFHSQNQQQFFGLQGEFEEHYLEPLSSESSTSIYSQLSVLVDNHIKEHIDRLCSTLRINPDPRLWSEDDVRKWMVWQAQEYCPNNQLDLYMFKMNGQDFCNLSEQDFQIRTPIGGNNFYAQLEIWKNACKLVSTSRCEQTTCYFDLFESRSNSEPPVSPSLSLTSDEGENINNNYIPILDSDGEQNCCPSSPEERRPRHSVHKQNIHLWQFLKELLHNPEKYSSCIRWVDKQSGVFKIEDSAKVAKTWGQRKNRPAMNYDKLSRSIRQYYKKGIIKKTTQSKRLVYQFCPNYL